MILLIKAPGALLAMYGAVLFFLTALLTGCWKYFSIRRSPEAQAPHYVNIAHRAALMYSFASVLLALLAALSAFPNLVNVIAAALPLAYFAIAIARYIQLGILNRTDNQHLNPPSPTGELVLLLSLMIAEIGGFLVLAVGFTLRVMSGS